MPVSLYQSALQATEIFRTFQEGDPDLIDLGIGPVTRNIGGVFAGNLVGVAAGQNVGKSSFALMMGANSQHLGGVISMEDGPDVWGARLLAKYSNVPPSKIRRKDLTEEDKDAISEALGRMRADSEAGKGPIIDYRVGGSIEGVEAAVAALAEAGCRWIIFDYLQKPRGHAGGADRRVEVGVAMNRFHKACADANVVPVMFSQIVRLKDGQEPFPGHMKESGDIENECRLIIMLWRDASDPTIVRGKVAKSSFGGGGLRFAYKFTEAEYLVEYSDEEEAGGSGEEF